VSGGMGAGRLNSAIGRHSRPRGRSHWRLIQLACVALVLTIALLSAVGRDDPIAAAQEAAHHGGLPKLKVVRELKPARHAVSFLRDEVAGEVWSSDGTKLAAYSEFGNLVTVWSADGKVFQELQRPGMSDGVISPLAFVADNREIVSPSGCYVAVRRPSLTCDIAFTVFDVASGKIVREVKGPHAGEGGAQNAAYILVSSPDETLLAVVIGRGRPGPLTLYSTRTWEKVGMPSDVPKPMVDAAVSIAFSRDGTTLAEGRLDGTVIVYNVLSKREIRRISAFHFPEPTLSWVALSPHGAKVAVGGSGSGDVKYTGPNGQILTRSSEHPVRVFSTNDGSLVAAYPEHVRDVWHGQWSPDGRFIAFTAISNRILYCWNPLRPNDTRRDIAFRDPPTSLAFSPDGRELAIATGEKISVLSIGQSHDSPDGGP